MLAGMSVLLLVDDDPTLLELLKLSFSDDGHRVVTAVNGLEGSKYLEKNKVDLVICDVNMPVLDGFTLCRQLREAGNQIPFILLTSRDHEVDEAMGLELGADDYVTKPFSTRILKARVTALLRREAIREGGQDDDHSWECGPLWVCPERLEISWHDMRVGVTVSEFRLIETLAQRPGVVFDREKLLDRVRGDESIVVDRIIDTWVARVRRKFTKIDEHFDALETVVGVGYRWNEQEK